jgi:c-di-AMP phosphodiesterase-like protein
MKNRSLWSVTNVVLVYLLVQLLELCALTVNIYTKAIRMRYMILSLAGIFLILLIFGIYKIITQHRDAQNVLNQIFKNMSGEERRSFMKLQLPVAVTNKSGEILWYNDSFLKEVIDGESFLGENLKKYFESNDFFELEKLGIADLKLKKKNYTVYKNPGTEDTDVNIYYFVDVTSFRALTSEYKKSRPVVALITIDNMSEILKGAKESEKAVLSGRIENLLEHWAGRTTGIFRKYDSKRFIMIMEERHLKKYIDDKFDILNKIRGIKVNGREHVTISIGIGRGEQTLAGNEEMAKQALDMALGRGGDHVAIKTGDNFEFFGGVSAGTEKGTKVKTRVISASFKKALLDADKIFVMGHRFGDLDSLGSSIAIRKIAESLGKESYIVTDKEKSLAQSLLKDLLNTNPQAVIDEKTALQYITQQSLLVITDTHRPEFLEFREIYDVAQNVVVIDHHRKTVEYIEDASIFFHEPTASSASEMVAEMLEYIGSNIIGEFEATALMAGIMLDTKNFVVRTGSRTFEAAGVLKSLGADTVEAKEYFAQSPETYKLKSSIVSAARRYNETAISVLRTETEDSRIAASQAADEMLSIDNVKAAFVIFQTGNTINISARSFGKINVQLIMEQLGGGGHQTMAAAQLENNTFEEAEARLQTAIDDYITKNKTERK